MRPIDEAAGSAAARIGVAFVAGSVVVLLAQYAGLYAVAGWSVGREWREGRWGADGWGSTALFTFGAAAMMVLLAGGVQLAVGPWVPRKVGLAVVLAGFGFGGGWGLVVLLVGGPPAAVFFLVPLVGARLRRLWRGAGACGRVRG